ncbi:MAG: AAA family ATPase [Candidatus Omnitrophica bacterium]|nr:AAA family ATPase [Candidatus Omnitrophota bacterium]
MYLDYWHFKEKPFENTPDPRFFYCSNRHEEALMRFLYALQERKAAFMLSGEYGSGKTLLSRVVIGRLMQKEDDYKVALIVNPAIPSIEILSEIVYQLGGNSSSSDKKTDILRQLNEMLYRTAELNKHTVIIIDEAQAITDEETFEELRLLLNFQTSERFLFTLVLLGQPELIEKIDRLPQLRQRLALRFHLTTLTEPEAKKYIEHRCQVAGRDEPVFSDEAHRFIYEYSKGIPRQMNNFCDLSLVIGMGEKASVIDERIAKVVVHDFYPSLAA